MTEMKSASSWGALPSLGEILFLCVLVLAGWGLVGLVRAHPLPAPEVEKPDLAQKATRYLRKTKKSALSGPLLDLLANPGTFYVKSMPHELLGLAAPDFELSDCHGKKHKLTTYLERGPVVLIFYFGYHCNHCVSQLFDVNEDLHYFKQLGATVLAISADPPEETLERFKEYGEFNFPVLSDPKNEVAEDYGVLVTLKEGRGQLLFHGTFLIDAEGHVQWVNIDDKPFSANRTLLYKLARMQGKVPSEDVK
jgi:peroxiredoxin Q/BCP